MLGLRKQIPTEGFIDLKLHAQTQVCWKAHSGGNSVILIDYNIARDC